MKTCSVEGNKKMCNCTYFCSRKGICCECLEYHRQSGELPACYFNKEYEATYDRSVRNYLKMTGRS
ncbi:MAG: DUF6485 family protein [Bacteroidota bacterium]